jgi:hypothetical protein
MEPIKDTAFSAEIIAGQEVCKKSVATMKDIAAAIHNKSGQVGQVDWSKWSTANLDFGSPVTLEQLKTDYPNLAAYLETAMANSVYSIRVIGNPDAYKYVGLDVFVEPTSQGVSGNYLSIGSIGGDFTYTDINGEQGMAEFQKHNAIVTDVQKLASSSLGNPQNIASFRTH